MSSSESTLAVSAQKDVAQARDLQLAILILGFWTATTLWLQWDHWPEDLTAVYIAGWLWNHGQLDLIYAAPPGFFNGPADSWRPILDAIGGPDEIAFPYVYPPLWAVLAAPFAALTDVRGFANGVALFQFPMLAGSVLLAARLFRPASVPLWLWSAIGVAMLMFSIPSFVAIGHNQPTITMMFLILLSFERLAANRPVAAGTALAFAAALKLTPAIFVLIFLFDRQYRAMAAFAVAGSLLALLSLGLAGLDLHFSFLNALQAVKSSALLSAVNVSVKPALMSLGAVLGFGEALDMTRTGIVLHPVPFWLGPVLIATALAIGLSMFRALRRWPAAEARALALLGLAILVPLFGPLGWQHYYVLPMLMLPGFFSRLPTAQGLILAPAYAVLSLTLVGDLIVYLPWPLGNFVWIHVAMWMALLAALVVFVRRGPVSN